MYNQRNNSPFGGGNRLFGGSRYQYETVPYGYEATQTGGLISKVMGLLAFSFLFAAIGTFAGFALYSAGGYGIGTYFIVAIGGLVVLIILNFTVRVPGLNLFLLYLFTFLEGMSLTPIIAYYLATNANILGEAFLITTIASLGLAVYAWTTRRSFAGIGTYLFVGLIVLIVLSIAGIFFQGFFHTTLIQLFISILGIAIFSGYVLYYVQSAKNVADTMPNAILLTVSIFISVLNLFLFILRLLSILQGGDRRR